MRRKPQSVQPVSSPAAPEQPTAWRAHPPSVPLGAFLVICASVTALMRITHPLRDRPATNHLRRTHLTDNWAVACNYKSSITQLLQLRNRRGVTYGAWWLLSISVPAAIATMPTPHFSKRRSKGKSVSWLLPASDSCTDFSASATYGMRMK